VWSRKDSLPMQVIQMPSFTLTAVTVAVCYFENVSEEDALNSATVTSEKNNFSNVYYQYAIGIIHTGKMRSETQLAKNYAI
jgi:hypothetical protein